LVLLAPGVSGAPDLDEALLEPETLWLDARIDEQVELGNLEEANCYETWLWLDGPEGPEGRVGGMARELALNMNRIALANDVSEESGRSFSAWDHLEQVGVPTLVACGSLDVRYLIEQSQTVAARIPGARYRRLEGMAHLPYLEDPAAIAKLVVDAIQEGPRQ
jgi:pimeloyl-ACP methyl ester carboxylesterase